MLSKLFKLFSFESDLDGITADTLFKEEEETPIAVSCGRCPFEAECVVESNERYLCLFAQMSDYDIDESKPCIVLLDDNEGVVSFLRDDLQYLHDKGYINLSDYNVLGFTTEYAVFHLLSTIKTRRNMKVKLAVLDITIGGSIHDRARGNIILDGVDAFIETMKLNPDMKYVFFTGNKLNEYINKNKLIMDKFEKFTQENIHNHTMFKTSLSQEDRRMKLYELLK